MLVHCKACASVSAMSTSSPSSSLANYLVYIITLLLLQPLQQYPCYAMQQATSLGVHIVRSPESAVAPKGDEVVFECELNLAPDRLEWRFRHTSSRAKNAKHFQYLRLEDGYNITNDDRISKLRIFVAPDTLGDYQCIAWYGSAAIASISARLTLVSISVDNSNGFTHGLKRFSVAPKNCILLRCGTVTSNPPAVWSFYRNGEKVPQTEVLPSNGALILNSVSAKDSGNYSCSAMNGITGVEVKLPQGIDVRVDYTDRTPPYFLLQPSLNVTARKGETVVLECPGVGSPPPGAVWSSPNVKNIYHNRTKVLPYGLQISDVQPGDRGSYICRLDNGIAPPLVINIILNVLEQPKIIHGPVTTLTNEGDPLELECSATGNPTPDIYWLINGEDTALDNETVNEEKHLIIRQVQKRHAGIVQCFAKNEVGETSEGNLLQVNPKQIQGEGSAPLGNVPTRSSYEHTGNKNKGKRKHMKMPNMIPPSRPNVTRLSDDSVMLRWYVPKNDGLHIQFFKVQYRMLGDSLRKIPRENWQTTNEDIPYGKRDRNFEGIKNFTSSVSGLKPDRFYRFRIIAVYSNNDNKEGNTSAKFFLQYGAALGPTKSNLPAPDTVRFEAISETAIMLYWTLPANTANMIDGFYAYYRPAYSAGEYLKATVDGMQTRKFKIDMLDPGTTYEFKLQSFNALAASEFSSILQGKTKKLATTPAPKAPAVIPSTKVNEDDNSIYPVVAGAAGGGILLLIATIAACLCMKRRKNSQPEDEDKPQLDHIQADFVTPAVLGVSAHHKTGSGHRLNGVIPRMNITPNPLAQEADKTHLASSGVGGHQGLHHAQPYHHTPSPGTPTMLHKRDYQMSHNHNNQHPPPVPPHQNNNHHYHTHHGHASAYQQPPSPVTAAAMEQHRRTLERSTRNLHYPHTTAAVNASSPPAPAPHDAAMNVDGLPTRIPSLRRTRRTSGNANNNNGGVGIPIVPGSPRAVQRSPMPARAIMKRNRLGSHNDNISSGSLNSIEV